MPQLKNRFQKFKISHLKVVGIAILIFLALLLLWFNSFNNSIHFFVSLTNR